MTGRPTIALAMIVRDEAAIIERCLNSVKNLVDLYVIVDTGSTDDTIAKIRAFPIDGEVHEREWVNFGHNRTELMQLAFGKADYLLLLDADHTVAFDADRLAGLDADSYLLRHPGEPEFWLRRLVRGDWPWHYVGVTHEYITATDRTVDPPQRLNAIVVLHHGDGAHRREKSTRDLQLLRDAYEQDPDDPRTVFYLANTLRDLWHTTPDGTAFRDEAVALYRRRAEMGGWAEEVFCALLEAGRLADDVETLLEAWSRRPRRAEALYELAWRFRMRRQYAAAHLFAQTGAAIPLPCDDVLFVHRWVYEWGCLFELSISAWYVGRVWQAREATDLLLSNPALPAAIQEQVVANRDRFIERSGEAA